MTEPGTCGAPIRGFYAHPSVLAICDRPLGHTGDHWPMPLATDRAALIEHDETYWDGDPALFD